MPGWDEQIPGGGTSATGPTPQGQSPVMQLLAQMMKQKQGGGGGAPTPGGTSARVGGPPPAMTPTSTPGGMPIPGLMPMSPAQAGGPEARYGMKPVGDPGREFSNPHSRDAAVVSNTVNGISNAVVKYKQQKFEQEAAKTSQITTQLIQSQMIQAKIQRGEPITQQDLQQAMEAGKMDPKVMKLFEKAQKDPMSGAYVGIQRAQQQAQANLMQQAELDKQKAEAEEKRAQAEYYRGAGKFQTERADLERDKMQVKQQGEAEKVAAAAPYKQGMIAVRNPDGSVKLNDNGQPMLRPMTDTDVAGNPELRIHYEAQKALITQRVSAAKSGLIRAQVASMKEERIKRENAEASAPGAITAYEKQLQDPTSGVTLAQVPSKVRNAVVADMEKKGVKIAKPLSNDEIKRMDLANNALHNIQVAQEILTRRPDLFGPGGWGKSKYELAVAGGDKDAIRYAAATKLMNLPLVGIHGVRGKWAVEDLDKYDSNLYLNPDSMKEFLDVAEESATQFRDLGGRPTSVGGKDTSSSAKKPPLSSFENK